MVGDLRYYEMFRQQMATADMLEWSSYTALGYAIRWVTKQDVNHTSLVVRLSDFENLRERRFTIEALEHGVAFNLISARLSRYKGKVYWYQLAKHPEARNKVAAWALEQVGSQVKYDYKSLFLNAVSRVSTEASKLYCTELVQMAYQAAKIIKQQNKALQPGELEKLGLHKERVLIYDSNSPNIIHIKGGNDA